ncbi:undecaprenyl-phosphate glucose phosphotransferase [Cycloclasticus pugetii]|uniref:undecaprenyl-phosphate glucose phosphotransferase n=1 Tax=Cycloclasticus pugetii TaxID=34068 RepID=UPI0003706778|nr:undecaprenyl-phosphate glucose phosphotransferase [Cycloclasticus pugetii]
MDGSKRGMIRDLHHLSLLFKVFDVSVIYFSLYFLVSFFGNVNWVPQYNLLALIAVLVFGFAAEIARLYQSWRGVDFILLVRRLCFVWFVVTLCLLILGYTLRVTSDFSRLILLAWFLVTPIVLLSLRALLFLVLKYFRSQGYNSRQVSIVGANELSSQIIKHIQAKPFLGMRIEGLYDDRTINRDDHAVDLIIGDTRSLVDKVKSGDVDIVYITLPMKADQRIKQLILDLSDTTASVYLIPDLYTYQLFNGQWSNLGGHPVVSVFETPFNGIDAFLKRSQDVILSLLILMLISPLLLVIAAAVKATSPGPVFFKQRRYGISGEDIYVWKFRSMSCEDDGDLVRQATRNDCRITPLGGFLRRTSLDELPQFFNVLFGDMSVVGPRPHAAAHNELYRSRIRGYMLRHAVKPGITGWAQINGWRGETDTLEKMEKRIEYDHWYISNWSILLDIKIIFLTIFKGFVSKNAY